MRRDAEFLKLMATIYFAWVAEPAAAKFGLLVMSAQAALASFVFHVLGRH